MINAIVALNLNHELYFKLLCISKAINVKKKTVKRIQKSSRIDKAIHKIFSVILAEFEQINCDVKRVMRLLA